MLGATEFHVNSMLAAVIDTSGPTNEQDDAFSLVRVHCCSVIQSGYNVKVTHIILIAGMIHHLFRLII